jgi:uncharacterized protein YndB with AHSA1/START domain
MWIRAPLLALAAAAGCTSLPNAPSPDLLFAQAYIRAPYDRVWQSFTQADSYAAWHSTPCRLFGARAGEICEWADGDRLVYRGTLLAFDEGRGLSHTLQFIGFGFDESPSRVDIEIVERGPTVLVTVRHDCRSAPRTRDVISPLGWAKSLSRLKTLLETGTAMPWPTEG